MIINLNRSQVTAIIEALRIAAVQYGNSAANSASTPSVEAAYRAARTDAHYLVEYLEEMTG